MQNKTQPSPRVTWCSRCCSSRWRWCPCPASPRCSPPSSPQQSSGPPEGRATPIYFLLKYVFEFEGRDHPGTGTHLCSAPRRPSTGLSAAPLELSFQPLGVTEAPAPAAGRGGLRGVFVHGDPGLGLTAAPPLPSPSDHGFQVRWPGWGPVRRAAFPPLEPGLVWSHSLSPNYCAASVQM